MGIVYDDDTSIIPRSTTVIARRLPPSKPGRGGAARYVSGKMPQNAKNIHRSEAATSKPLSNAAGNELNAMIGAQTEEDRVAAMFKMGADQWAQQQQEMAKSVPNWNNEIITIDNLNYSATPVHRAGHNKAKSTNVPDHPPPSGYICYRCGEKGHWIQICPTNDDPAYENRPRVKRTTGIPRSFLKTVEKPTALANDGTIDDTKQFAGLMVNAEGEYVIAEPDKAAWDHYQAKAKISAAAQEAANRGNKDLQDRGLECSIDKHLFVDPTKTPCCQTTFCHDCVVNALLENYLRCPECSAENIPIDDLTSDKDMIAKIRSYEDEKALDQAKKQSSNSPEAEKNRISKSSPIKNPVRSLQPLKSEKAHDNLRKRSADSDLVNERTPPGPLEKFPSSSAVNSKNFSNQGETPVAPTNASKSQPSSHLMAYPDMNNLTSMGMTMDPIMGTNPALYNSSGMPNGTFLGNEWNIWGGPYQQQPMGMQGNTFSNHMLMGGTYNRYSNFDGMNLVNGLDGMKTNGVGLHGSIINGQGGGSFANQQRTTFSAPSKNDEDSAYFRKPVNPHRHQARRHIQRPTDYREI